MINVTELRTTLTALGGIAGSKLILSTNAGLFFDELSSAHLRFAALFADRGRPEAMVQALEGLTGSLAAARLIDRSNGILAEALGPGLVKSIADAVAHLT